MVYDEGFNVDLDEFSFFAFSKYTIEKSNKEAGVTINNSYCYQTSVGWYHNQDKTKWGCFYATKSIDNYYKPTSVVSNSELQIATEKQKLLEPMRFKQQFIKQLNNKLLSKQNKLNKQQPVINLQIKQDFSLEEYFKYLETIPKKFKISNYDEYKNMTYKDLNMKAGRIINNIKSEANSNVNVNKKTKEKEKGKNKTNNLLKRNFNNVDKESNVLESKSKQIKLYNNYFL